MPALCRARCLLFGLITNVKEIGHQGQNAEYFGQWFELVHLIESDGLEIFLLYHILDEFGVFSA